MALIHTATQMSQLAQHDRESCDIWVAVVRLLGRGETTCTVLGIAPGHYICVLTHVITSMSQRQCSSNTSKPDVVVTRGAGNSTTPATAVATKVKAFLGLQWQKWCIVLGSIAGVLILFYALKSCLPCWSWSKTIVRLVWSLLKCLFGCCCCIMKALPKSNSPEAIRREEVGSRFLLFIFF